MQNSSTGKWLRMRIYVDESDRYKGKALYIYLLELLRRRGLRGATVYRAIAGFGAHSLIHLPSLLRFSEDLPIVIEVVDEERRIREVLEEIKQVVQEGLITLEEVEVVFYGHRGEQREQGT